MKGKFGDLIDAELGAGSSNSQSQSGTAPDSLRGAWLSRLWKYPPALIWGYASSPANLAEPPEVLLERALREDKPALLREAIRQDANLTIALDEDKRTVLHRAAFQGKSACVQALLSLSADKEAKDAQGRTPLHLAVCNGRLEALKVLIEAGANKNAPDSKKNTPLHLGAWWGQIECVISLCEFGADLTLLNSYHKTPLQVALDINPSSELSQYLQVVSVHSINQDNGAGVFYQ